MMLSCRVHQYARHFPRNQTHHLQTHLRVGGEGDESVEIEDPEQESIKARVRAMEEEAEKLRQVQVEVDKHVSILLSPTGNLNLSFEEKMEVDNKSVYITKSVYIGNVDYGATAEELEQHFHGCGSFNRGTILCNKFDGHPKGFAYAEVSDKKKNSPEISSFCKKNIYAKL